MNLSPIDQLKMAMGEQPIGYELVSVRRSGGECGKVSACMVVGLVVLFLLWTYMKEEEISLRATRSTSSQAVSGLFSFFGFGGGGDAHTKAPLHKTHNLTHCKAGDSSCKDITNVDPSVLQKNDRSVHNFLNSHDECVVMIFAPWCGHCHNTMPHFTSASRKSEIPFAIVNAELVSPSVIHGDGSLFNVKHFPYIVKKQGKGEHLVFKDVPTEENISNMAKKSSMDLLFS